MASGKIYAALTGSVFMAAVFMVGAVAPADAQVVRIPQAAPDQVLPVHEVVTILRSTGLAPLGAPVRQGVTYRLRAIDRSGRDLNVVVDARYGDILLVEPTIGAAFQERQRMVAIPPDYDDPELYDRPPDMYSNLPPPNPPRVIKQAPTPHVATVPAEKRPPLPRSRPDAVAAQSAPSIPPAPAAAPPAAKAETAPAHDAPTKWKDEPAPTNPPASTPKVPDVTPLE